jgi:hypothetical protein
MEAEPVEVTPYDFDLHPLRRIPAASPLVHEWTPET